MENDLLKGPLSTSIEITNQCMFSCLHCYNRSGDDLARNELSDSELINISNELANIGLHTFCFCGGEPLIRYELILKMASILSKTCPNLNMVSNGYLLDEIKATKLKEAGIKLIQISIDGATAKTHDYMRGVAGSFEKALNAVRILEKVGIQNNIAFSPTRFNIEELPKLLNLLENTGNVNTVRIQPLMLLGRGSVNEIAPTEQQYRKLLKFLNDYQSQNKLTIEWGDPIDHLIRFSAGNLEQGSFSEIKSDGSVFISSYLPISVGNLRKHSYKEYWDSGLYKSWNIPLVQEIANYYSSVTTLGSSMKGIPKIFFDTNINFDLIDDKVFENLNDYTLDHFTRRNLHESK